jgi:hypothetical protein
LRLLRGTALALALACCAVRAEPQPPAAPLNPRKLMERAGPDEALEKSVEQIERDPAQAGAWLDLAVGLCQKGRGADAMAVLSHVQSAYSPPEGILEVINLLRASSCEGPHRDVRVTVAAQRGYDNNVNQGASNPLFAVGTDVGELLLVLSPDFLPKGDHYRQADAGLAFRPRQGVQVNLQVREKRYDRLFDLNTRIAAASAEKDWICFTGGCAIGATLGRIDLGGKPYQYVGNVQAAWTSAPGRWGGAVAFEAGLTRQKFPSEPTLDAWIGLGKVTWKLPAPAGQIQLSSSAGLDVPTSDRPGGRRTLAALGAAGFHDVPYGLQVDWSLQSQLTHDASVYSPPLINSVRRPLLRVATVGLTKSLTASQKLRLEYRYTDNRDTVSLFSYRSNALALSWQWRGDF